MTSDDDRIAYLAGEPGAPLDPDERADLDSLRDLLGDPSVWEEPDPSMEDRVVAALAAETGTSDRPPGLARRAGDRVPQPRFSRPRRLVYGAAGSAAAVIIAVALTLGVVAGGSTAPAYSAALTASGAAPGTSGSATFTRTTAGWRIELRTNGLPRLDQGRFYQAWMVDRAGARVAVGTFNQGPDVTLWSGVSPADFPRITVTAQEVTAMASPGRSVLAGGVTPPK